MTLQTERLAFKLLSHNRKALRRLAVTEGETISCGAPTDLCGDPGTRPARYRPADGLVGLRGQS
jgi:hypothetical protein